MLGIATALVIGGGIGVLVMGVFRAKVFVDLRDSNMRLADQVCALHARLQRIRDIPCNGKKPNGSLVKAQRIAGGEG